MSVEMEQFDKYGNELFFASNGSIFPESMNNISESDSESGGDEVKVI